MCQVIITSDQLKRFPASVPMNIREAVLVAAQGITRICEDAALTAAHRRHTALAAAKATEAAHATSGSATGSGLPRGLRKSI